MCRSSALGVCGKNTLKMETGDEWTPLPQEDQITGLVKPQMWVCMLGDRKLSERPSAVLPTFIGLI